MEARIAYPPGRSWAPHWWQLPLYILFAVGVFLAHGMQPVLGPDHITYFQMADEIDDLRPNGDYWRETNSVRSFSVILAYLYPLTGSHVLSMKLVLLVSTILYLVTADLFFSLFTTERWQAVLFAILSAFAVSFGFGSWGVTDSTALLARTLVAPVFMFSLWLWLRYRDHWARYLAFPVLICGSLLHLSTFHALGILLLIEGWDFIFNRRLRIDWRIPACLGGLALAAALLYVFEVMGLSVRVIHNLVPKMFAAKQFVVAEAPPAPVTAPTKPAATSVGKQGATSPSAVPSRSAAAARRESPTETAPAATVPDVQAAAKPAVPAKPPVAVVPTAKQAWDLELKQRPWRNMPLPAANIANMLSSFVIILALCLAGIYRARKAGFNWADRFMLALFVAVPAFAFVPPTILWILRSFTNIYPATIEEVRAIGFIMVPALYFVLRLVQIVATGEGRVRVKIAAIVLGVLALPLGLKSLPTPVREAILSVMVAVRAVDASQESSLHNARVALGIMHTSPFYYSTLGTVEWVRRNTPAGSRILTDREELLLARGREVIGPRQVASVVRRDGFEVPEMTEVYFRTKEALQSRDTAKMRLLAERFGADYFVLPWAADDAVYRDQYFSVVKVRR